MRLQQEYAHALVLPSVSKQQARCRRTIRAIAAPQRKIVAVYRAIVIDNREPVSWFEHRFAASR
jgi:hypothetical protein